MGIREIAMTRKLISRKDIEKSKCPFDTVYEFICDLVAESNNVEFKKLPFGFTLVYPIIELDSEILNGGFWQYMSNNTNDNTGEIKAVDAASSSLKTMGAYNHATLVGKSYECWSHFADLLARDMSATVQSKEGTAAVKCLKRLDKIYYCTRDEMVDTINKYIMSHLDDFTYERPLGMPKRSRRRSDDDH